MTDDLHDQVAGYAMDALTPDERAAFEAHLAQCADCRDELDGLRETLADWGSDFAVEPPETLRAAVLDAVAQLPAPSAQAAKEPPITDTRPATDDPPATDTQPATVTALPARDRSGWERWRVLVAAALAVVAVIGISVWQPWAPRAITAADVLAAPDAVRATSSAPGGGSATLVRSNSLGRAVLITQGMAPAQAGTVHQAWLMHPSGGPTSAGLMADAPDQTMLLEGDARDATGAGISVEPPGGSTEPTTVIIEIGL
ncbi:anti-sigma factor [Micropruina sonneratiae]|uniref:anti-sigma factor n=1 Tax=Micropruina sonneratiae TaxID=2986940 RepID=UPI0022268B7F|nr:anti-sigma factor [Micropruina sp. KQZ13P-5]MCW3158858.1 anti-sigma factor [Micropruina sp. KQZ13P-5]